MGKKRSSRRKTGRKIVRLMAVLLLVWLAAGVIQNRDSIKSQEPNMNRGITDM